MPVDPVFSVTKTSYGNMENNVEAVVIPSRSTEGATQQKETRWRNTNFTKWFGAYKKKGDLHVAINTKAIWCAGKPFECDDRTKVITDHVQGWGYDTFRGILMNHIIIADVCGNSYSEVIRKGDKPEGLLLNLKPLNPERMVHVVNDQGQLLYFEQDPSTKDGKVKKFEPWQIFYLPNNRVGDEIHGQSVIEPLQDVIDAEEECFSDIRQLMHRFVRPKFHFQLNTDNQAEIDAFILKYDWITNKGENLYTPKGTVEADILAMPSASTLNPLPWLETLKNKFFKAISIPQIILGNASEFSESATKIAYLSWEQYVQNLQTTIEEQLWAQLQLKIKLIFPASLQNELISDTAKDGQNAFKPSDTTAGVGA